MRYIAVFLRDFYLRISDSINEEIIGSPIVDDPEEEEPEEEIEMSPDNVFGDVPLSERLDTGQELNKRKSKENSLPTERREITSAPNYEIQFINSIDMWRILQKRKGSGKEIITIAIPEMRNVYYENRDLLSKKEALKLDEAVLSPIPRLRDVPQKEILPIYRSLETTPKYLQGTLTKWDMIHISRDRFSSMLRDGKPLAIPVEEIGMTIVFHYDEEELQ